MFEKQDCNYDAYRKIIKKIKQTNKYMDYKEALNSDSFIVMRHDIEFSIDRAYKLSEIEAECDLNSSYFVQITNNSYNTFSQKNIDLLKEILKMGHKIGLHFHRNGEIDISQIKAKIIFQAQILSQFLDINVDRFSFHRPALEHLKADIKVPGMINTYGSDFFTLTDDVLNLSNSNVKYISDSNHGWKYGLPTEEYFEENPKIQILMHPLSWSEGGENHVKCFQEIMNEKNVEFIDTVKNEWKIYYMLEGKLKC